MKNKKYWLLTSLVTLLPVLAGLLLWDRLPDHLPTHFGFNGTADGWGSKAFAVFGLPALMLLFHWIVCFVSRLDKQNLGHNEKVLDLIGLIFPAMSVVFAIVIYNAGLGLELNMTRLMLPLLGIFFLLVGNWLPKIKQNSTLGIKLPWTLYNEENWNRTHRVGGFSWVIGGLGFIILGFVPEGDLFGWALLALVLGIAGVPTVYSWCLARKQKAAGRYTESAVSRSLKDRPVVRAVSIVAVTLILLGTAVVMFTGEIECTVTDTTLTIEADYYDDLTVSLDAIDGIEYRDSAPEGIREFGWGSARLMLGTFRSDEFGLHTRYTYVACEACIILRSGDDVLVLNAADEASTRALYEAIAQEVSR